MKRILFALLIALALLGFSACESAPEYKDGTYTAEEQEFSNGYRYFVEITVEEGKIAEVVYDAYSEDGSETKDAKSRAGNYPMKEKGNAQWDWHVQADNLEEYLVSTQSTQQPDAITGATIGIDSFYTLVNEALAEAKLQ